MADVELEPHDSTWRDAFRQERDRLYDVATDDLLDVFHVGSTAVPELEAKPNIDVVAVYRTSVAVDEAKEVLLDEYELHRDDEEWIVLTRSGDSADFVVHLVPHCAQRWRNQLVFRELLRDDPAARERYEQAKRAAAETHPDDVDAYTDAKEGTISSLTTHAYEEGYDDRLPDLSDQR